MIEINLVPDVKQELIRAQRIRATVIMFSIILGIVSIAVVSLLASFVFVAQNLRNSIADKAITTQSAALSSVEDLSKTVTIQNQLTKITALNSEKMIDSRIFDMLVAIIPPQPNDVKFSSLLIDSATGRITIDAQAANGYTALEVFKKTIERANVKFTDAGNVEQSVLLAAGMSQKDGNYGSDSSGVKVLRFTISFEYAKDLFSPNSKNVKVKVTGGGDVTDSTLGLPKSIFTTPAVDLTEEE